MSDSNLFLAEGVRGLSGGDRRHQTNRSNSQKMIRPNWNYWSSMLRRSSANRRRNWRRLIRHRKNAMSRTSQSRRNESQKKRKRNRNSALRRNRWNLSQRSCRSARSQGENGWNNFPRNQTFCRRTGHRQGRAFRSFRPSIMRSSRISGIYSRR